MKLKKNVLVAESEDEAWSEARKYAAQLGYGFDAFDDNAQEHIIRVAQDPDEGGWPQAEAMIYQPKRDNDQSISRTNREQRSTTDFNAISGNLGDALADQIFDQARAAYVGGENRNPTFGRSCTQAEVNAAMDIWEAIDGTWQPGFVNNFHGYRRQDKAAVGTGNVGDTLATRGVQANFISTWGKHTVNVHVDIEG